MWWIRIKDGIVEVGLTLSNVTQRSGQEFRVCAVVLNTLQTVCSIGHNSPSQRAEFVDIVLDSNDNGIKQNNKFTVKTNDTVP